MSDLTTYAEEQFLQWSFTGSSMPTAHSNVHIALHTSDPGDAPDGSTEVSAGDYDRASVSASTTNFTVNVNDGSPSEVDNDNEISFGVATSSWGTVTHFSVWDGSTSSDNPLWASDLAQSKSVESNDEIRFLAGDLTAQID